MEKELAKDTTVANKTRAGQPLGIFKIPHMWYITTMMAVCSILYYLDLILDLMGFPNPGWSIFLITHDLHLFFFSIPLLYAAYVFRVRGIVVVGVALVLIFIPRAVFNAPYLEPFFRAILFTAFIALLGILIAYVQNRRIQIIEAYTIVKQHAEKLIIAETAIKTCISAIATANLDGDLTYVNPAFLKIWGYENAEEVLGGNFALLCNEEEKVQQLFQTLQITRETEAAELAGKRKGGGEFIIGLKASIIRDTEGHPIGITASMADITNRCERTEQRKANLTKSR